MKKLSKKEKKEIEKEIITDVFFGLTVGDARFTDTLKAIRRTIDYTQDKLNDKLT